MKKALEQRCRGLWYLFVMNFDWNRFICRASTAMRDGFFFLGFLVVLREREREREKFIKREAEDDEIEKWGGGGLVFI